MLQADADPRGIDGLLAGLAEGKTVSAALAAAGISDSIRGFVGTTLGFIDEGNLCGMAAAFHFGRETLVPDLFT